MRKQSIDTRSGYDLWASSYDASDNPIVAVDGVIVPQVMEALGSLEGQHVVDAGCGTGRHTEWLARCAAHVLALDFSEGMLAQARERLRNAGNVSFLQQDLARPPYAGVDTNSMDGVLCALVGEHIPELPVLFRELRRMLRAGGWLVFSVYHPFLALLGKEANFVDPAGQVEYRLGAHRHLVSDYVHALSSSGASLVDLREVTMTRELCAAMPSAERLLDKPVLLVLVARA